MSLLWTVGANFAENLDKLAVHPFEHAGMFGDGQLAEPGQGTQCRVDPRLAGSWRRRDRLRFLARVPALRRLLSWLS